MRGSEIPWLGEVKFRSRTGVQLFRSVASRRSWLQF
jgi:hypothetical protein